MSAPSGKRQSGESGRGVGREQREMQFNSRLVRDLVCEAGGERR